MSLLPLFNDDRGAGISDCGAYRYSLWRRWGGGPQAVFVGLNPSTADAAQDDPTIRRCIRFARAWGYDGLTMANLYAYRSTDPRRLLVVEDPVGPENDDRLTELAHGAGIVIAAWGAWPGPDPHRPARVMDLIGGLHVLGFTKHHEPRHPLYMRADCQPIRWTVA